MEELNKIIEEFIEIEVHAIDWDKHSSLSYRRNLDIGFSNSLKKIFSQLEQQTREETLKEVIEKMGFLRQWLNEDRITDLNKMVTTDELLVFLISLKNNE